MNFKLGCNPSPHDNRTLRLMDYIDSPFLVHPKSWNWSKNVPSWPMMKNDQIGDCVPVAMGHMIMAFTAANGNLFVPSDDDIVKAYSDISGYDPATGANDNGCNMLEALKYWRNTGVAGHKIGAFAQIDYRNINHIKAAIYWFGGVFAAISVYQFMEDEFDHGETWRIPAASSLDSANLLGGHGVPYEDFDSHTVSCITWGAREPMSNNCLYGVSLEAWAVISEDFVTDQKPAPNGFSMDQLVADLSKVQGTQQGG